MFRAALMAVIAVILAGCVTTETKQTQPSKPPSASEVMAKATAMVEDCRTKFSESPSDALARAACFNDADMLFKNFARYPDLVDGRIAKRTELAKQIADAKMGRTQAMQEFAIFNLTLVREDVRRRKVNMPIADQQRAAAEGAALF